MQKLKQIKRLLFIALFALIVVNPVLVFAQTNTGTTTPPSANTGTPVYQNVQQSIKDYLCTPSEPADGHDLERCINKVYRFGVAFGAVALVFFVVFAGYMYITGGETGKSRAKGILQNALVGMGLLLGSYVLLSFVNPDLVVFRSIQPPIFSAPDIPTCDKVGLGDDCILPGGSIGVGTGNGGSKTVPTCSEGLVTVGSLGLPSTKGSGIKICKTLGEKLKAAYQNKGNVDWTITATIEGGHESGCHDASDPRAGNCADIAINGNPRTINLWESLCSSLVRQGISNIANEISPKITSNLSSYNTQSCGAAKDKTKPPYQQSSDGPSIHANYTGG